MNPSLDALVEDRHLKEVYSLPASADTELVNSFHYIEAQLQVNFRKIAPNLITKTRKAIRTFIEQGAEVIGVGRSRICLAFPDSNFVIKIPFSIDGFDASAKEAKAFENFQKSPREFTPMAECRFVDYRVSLNMQLLVMERIRRFLNRADWRTGVLPEWVDAVDCGQVGYDSKGKLVAYDL